MDFYRPLNLAKRLAEDTNGAVTVDWVVLTAFVVTLLGAGYGLMRDSASTVNSATSDYMASRAPQQ